MKSAYEIALERMNAQGIEGPSDDTLSAETRAAVSEARQRARAALAELEILHRDRLTKTPDPEARRELESDYLRDRRRIDDRCERDVRKLRQV